MMKKFLTMLAMAALCCVVGCNDDVDELEKEINSLKSRIEALEKQVTLLNSNIEALQALSQKGATITEVKCENGTYTITLSNGEVITLAQGSEAEAVIPVVAINEQGYWVVDYRDGAGFVEILVNGEPVKATADDGITPLFKIDADGFWTVSYDGGKSYERVLDVNGQPVNATGTGELTDKFFEEVKVEGDLFYVKLLTGEELRIPILPDFFCRIIAPEGVQLFTSKQTQRYSVEIRGVESVFLSAPTGWSAELTDPVDERATLIVTAPETSATRSLADNTKDVTILAMAGYYATIAKIQVEVEGSIVVTPPSVESVTLVEGSATESSLSFTITTSEDTDAWMYLLQPASEAAPEASTIASVGNQGVGTELTINNLEASTDYVLYVVAIKNPNTYSEVISSGVVSTTAPLDTNDYWTVGVTINGVTYSSETEGARLLTVAADATENLTFAPSEGGVIFVEDLNDTFDLATGSNQGLTKSIVVIGRNATKKTVIKMNNYSSLRLPEGEVIFKNIIFDASSCNNYVFNNGTGTQHGTGGAKNVIFEDCEIIFGANGKPFMTFYNAAVDSAVENIFFRNCKIQSKSSIANQIFITTSNTITTGLNKFKHLEFDNCIIYGMDTTTALSNCLFCQESAKNQASLAGSLENLEIVFTNNTVVDFASSGSGNGGAFFHVGAFKSLNVTNNIFYLGVDEKYPAVMRVFTDYNTTSWPSWTMDRTQSIYWGSKGWKLFFDGSGSYYPTATITESGLKTFVKASATPLSVIDKENGRFVKADDYATYGSTLQ